MNIHAGSTSYTLPIWIADTTSTTGGGLASLTSATSGLVAEYRREGQSSWTAITLSAGTLGTWSSGGFVADGSDTGAYELGLPNAATASLAGVRWVAVRLRGATNMLTTRWRVALDQVDYQDAIRLGLTGIPNAAAGANGGLPLGDASGRVDIGKVLGTASAGTAGYMAPDWGHVNAPTTTVNLSGTTVGTATALTNAPSDSSGTTTLLARLTSARAGYLDILNGIVAAIWAAVADSSGVTTLLARITSARAGYLDNLSTAPPTLAAIRADLERNGGSLYNIAVDAGNASTNAVLAFELLGSPTSDAGTIAGDIAAIDTGSGGASAADVVAAMTTAGFAKASDVQIEIQQAGQS